MSASDNTIHKGHCFCGAVEVTATGAPFAMGYCHCKDCRAVSVRSGRGISAGVSIRPGRF